MTASETTFRVGIDVGGTFTDICVLDAQTGALTSAKVPSTPRAPIEGVMAALDAVDVDLTRVSVIAHGTTVATNALITRNLPRAALITTAGFRDVIEIGDGTKEDLWDAYKDTAPPYIDRRHRYVIRERMRADGTPLVAPDESEMHAVVKNLIRGDYEAVAICFVNAYSNDEHERQMADAVRAALPDIAISTSSDVLPEIFENDRFSTTVATAVLSPLVGAYSLELEDRLRQRGYDGDLLLVHSGGGMMSPRQASRFAARLAGSGTAAGAVACRAIADTAGFTNAIGLDMGGTSADVSLIADKELAVHKEWHVEYGHPICFPAVDLVTIGAGGGSIANVDEGGALRSGPQSAGAEPGPACYRRGGTRPTTTDANLVLGRLGTALAGETVELDREASLRAIEHHVAGPLGIEVDAAAHAMLSVTNAAMADAVRLVSVRRGHDPRDFALVVFGGAGPLHGPFVARELAIPTVVVPFRPGVTSALGCLVADIQHDLSATVLGRVEELSADDLNEQFSKLEDEAQLRLETERVPPGAATLLRTVDMRYQGQWRSLSIPVPDSLELDAAVAQFHRQHLELHGYTRPDDGIEVYRINVTAIAPVAPDLRGSAETSNGAAPLVPAPFDYREVVFDLDDGAVETPIYLRDQLRRGARVNGPAIIEQADTTTLVPPRARASVDAHDNVIIHLEASRE